ncbi:MAG: permease prefix domain 1-containing protein [Phycisphaerae bacterium]
MTTPPTDETGRIQLAKLLLIERTVRPLRAATPRKLRIREELLAHLESIYAEELARTGNPDAALAESAKRFGNPAQLTRELQSTIPFHERIAHYLEKHYGWRAPEHASTYLLRLSLHFLFLFGIPFAAFAACILYMNGLTPYTISILYPALLTLLATPLALFLLGNLYFLTRDTLFGVFGSPRSKARIALLTAATFLTTFVIGAAMITARTGSLHALPHATGGLAIVATCVTLTSLLHARFRGPAEIAQTRWECLTLNTP